MLKNKFWQESTNKCIINALFVLTLIFFVIFFGAFVLK